MRVALRLKYFDWGRRRREVPLKELRTALASSLSLDGSIEFPEERSKRWNSASQTTQKLPPGIAAPAWHPEVSLGIFAKWKLPNMELYGARIVGRPRDLKLGFERWRQTHQFQVGHLDRSLPKPYFLFSLRWYLTQCLQIEFPAWTISGVSTEPPSVSRN